MVSGESCGNSLPDIVLSPANHISAPSAVSIFFACSVFLSHSFLLSSFVLEGSRFVCSKWPGWISHTGSILGWTVWDQFFDHLENKHESQELKFSLFYHNFARVRAVDVEFTNILIESTKRYQPMPAVRQVVTRVMKRVTSGCTI